MAVDVRHGPCQARSKTDLMGFDHGVGHPLLLLYDAKTPRGQKVNELNGLGDNPLNASVGFILDHDKVSHLYNYLIFLLFL